MELRHTLALVLVFGFTATAVADTIRVPKDQPNIQAAVTAAVDGDVIEIGSGKYDESVVIDGKTDLTLIGKGNVTIRPTVDGIRATNCTDLTIQNVRVQGGANGFSFEDCAGVLLERFGVKDTSGHGVVALDSSNVRVLRGKINDVGRDGVSFGDVDDETIAQPVSGGEISRVKVNECDQDGFDLLGTNLMVSRCSVKNADDDGFETDPRSTGPFTLDRCKAKNSTDEGFELFADNSTATNCSTVRAMSDGFDVEGDNSRLENCKAVRSTGSGLEIEHATNVTFLNCKSIRSGDDGVGVEDSTDCLIDGCKAIRSGDDGFFLDAGTSGIRLRNNKGAKSSDDDLDDQSGGQNDIDGSNKFKTVAESS